MKITTQESLVSWLNDLSLVQVKSRKDLRAQQISESAQQALSFIESDQQIPPIKKQELLFKLKAGLNQYLKRAAKVSTPLQKMGSLFGKKSRWENCINAVIRKSSNEISQLQGSVTQKSVSLKEFERFSLENEDNPLWFKIFSQLVLASSHLNPNEFRGFRRAHPLIEISQAFIEFWKTLNAKNADTGFPQVAHELLECFYFESHILQIICFKDDPEASKKLLEQLCSEYHRSISKLKPGERTLIAGGYRNVSKNNRYSSHAVIYEVLKETDGTVKFSIINNGTGAGREGIRLKKGFKPAFFTKDISFTGIPQSVLSKDFLTELLKFHLFPDKKKKTTMADIVKCIKVHVKDCPSVQQKKERKRGLQTGSSNFTKSLVSWLHGRLEPQAYRAFKIFITKRQIDSFLEQSSSLDPSSRVKIVEKAYGTLQKRIDKARQAGVSEEIIAAVAS